MELTINTDTKEVTIKGTILLKEVIATLKKLLPNNEWEEYKLKEYTPPFTPASPYTPLIPSTPWQNPGIFYNTCEG